MSRRTRSTIRALCVKSGINNQEIVVEAQRLLELYEDPDVAPEQKAVTKAELDAKIKELEERVTTRKLKEAKTKNGNAGLKPPAP